MRTTRIQIITNFFTALPALILGIRLFQENLFVNPIQTATIVTGRTAVYLLLISLFCSPLYNFFGMSMFLYIRKTTGLYAFYYAFFHFLIFSALDYQLNFSWILPELKQKPFLQIGLAALVLLIPLAVTSIRFFKQKLGKWWKRIHTLVYVITAIIMVHIALASKGDLIDPIILITIYLLTMLMRIPFIKKISLRKIPKWASNLNAFLTN